MNKLVAACRCQNTNATVILGNALAWAAAILIVSFFAQPAAGHNSFTVTGLLIACWFAMHSLLNQCATKQQ